MILSPTAVTVIRIVGRQGGEPEPCPQESNVMSPLSSICSVAPSDECLWVRSQRGDRQARAELFSRHRSLAYRVAYRLLGNEADALDAVQDGFVKALVNLESFRGKSTFKTWLLRVVTNAALDLGRQRGRRESLPVEHAVSDDLDAGHNPAERLERADLRRLLDKALAALPEAQRQTFVLHAEAELSYRDTAEVLGISIGTVMSRLYYARQKLRGFLGIRLDS
jgi:RNA polymerase sigma-70 factor (ECF subfamily)